MLYSRIIGTGSYLPERILTNDELAKTVDTDDAWIRARTGISERRIAAEGEFTSDLAYHASLNAIDAAGISADEIDLIVLATSTPDLVFPSTATILQEKLGNQGAPAFDIQAVCAGFAYALSVADQYVKSGAAKTALVVGAETFSRIIDWTDRATCVLFGDGAGAVVLQAGDEPGIYSTHIQADGRYKELLWVPSGVSNRYADVINANAFVAMDGQKVFRLAVTEMSKLAQLTIAENGMTGDDIDWLVPHQANLRIIEAVANKAGVPMDRVVITVDRHGNTSAASVPLALDEAVRDGRIKAGHTVLIEAFGGGFTWGSALFKL